jgi:aspartate/methionine/tyrosine aminotransferase
MQAFALPYTSFNGGNLQLRGALAAFFNTYFDPIHTVKPEHIVLTTGATDALENVIHAVCDDGDSVLVPGPHWRTHISHPIHRLMNSYLSTIDEHRTNNPQVVSKQY